MQHSFDAMRTALRVLTAITEKCQPDQNDVDALYGLAGPQPGGIGLDELACEVIQKALDRRAIARHEQGPSTHISDTTKGWVT
jgi:hypothetical protein